MNARVLAITRILDDPYPDTEDKVFAISSLTGLTETVIYDIVYQGGYSNNQQLATIFVAKSNAQQLQERDLADQFSSMNVNSRQDTARQDTIPFGKHPLTTNSARVVAAPTPNASSAGSLFPMCLVHDQTNYPALCNLTTAPPPFAHSGHHTAAEFEQDACVMVREVRCCRFLRLGRNGITHHGLPANFR